MERFRELENDCNNYKENEKRVNLLKSKDKVAISNAYAKEYIDRANYNVVFSEISKAKVNAEPTQWEIALKLRLHELNAESKPKIRTRHSF